MPIWLIKEYFLHLVRDPYQFQGIFKKYWVFLVMGVKAHGVPEQA